MGSWDGAAVIASIVCNLFTLEGGMEMLLRYKLLSFAVVGLFLLVTATGATAQNLLTNFGFEDGPVGPGIQSWFSFGNVYTEAKSAVGNQFDPLYGNQNAILFGNFTGGFNVSGFFQEFPTAPGETWQMSSNARHWSADAIPGVGAPGNNWVVQKLAFFDGANTEIGGVESTILDGTFAVDVWHPSGVIVGVAPPGTVKVQALILYLQPLFDGGAAHIDQVAVYNMSTVPTDDTTWGSIKALYND